MRSMFNRFSLIALLILSASLCLAQVSAGLPSAASAAGTTSTLPDLNTTNLVPVSKLEGLEFVNNSRSQILLEKDGKKYLVDTDAKSIHEISLEDSAHVTEASKGDRQPSTGAKDVSSAQQKERKVYYNEDINLWNLPTALHLEKNALIVDFTHRFSYDEVFADGSVSDLFGLDGFSISSFGLTYGLTDTFFVGAYRVPRALGRIIQLYGGAQLSQEIKGHPFSTTLRVAVEGANHFSKNFVTSLEFALARSIKQRVQLYFVPTISFNNRPLRDSFGLPGGKLPSMEGETTTAIGLGLSVDIRPTVAIVAEAIQRTSGLLGARRPSFMFGIQKKIYRHSFTLGVANSPGTTISQRSGTRATLSGTPDDTFGGLTVGFNLSRRLF